MVVRELLIKLGLTGGSATANQLDKIDGKVRQVSEGFSALGGVLTGVLAGLSISSISHIADDMQSLEFRLGQMVTSANGGAEAIDNLSQHAQKARVSIESYAEAYTGIGAATHELIHSERELLNVTDSVAMGLQLAGANTQQTTSVMMQLTQAIAVGKLQWADMRIIMQNSDAFAGRLAKSLGMTLNQMVQATQGKGGGIGADKIVYALRDMSEQVRKEFAQMPLTVKQATTVIGARWDMFIHRLNRSSGAVTWVADKFLWLADQVEYGLDVVVKALGGAENAVKLLGVALASAGIVGGIWVITAAFNALTSPILLVVAAIGVVLLALDDFANWKNRNPSILGDIFGDYSQYQENIEKFLGAIKWVKDAVGGWQSIFEAFAVYLGTKWLMSVLRTLGLASAAATKTGNDISTAGNGGGQGGGKGVFGKVANATMLYPIVDGILDSSIGDTKFGQWAKNTTLGDIFGSDDDHDETKPFTKHPFWWPEFLGGPGVSMRPNSDGGDAYPSINVDHNGGVGYRENAGDNASLYSSVADSLKGMFTVPTVAPSEMVPVSNVNNRSDVSQQFTYQPNNTYNIYPATNSGEDIRSSASSYDRDSYRNFRESIANDLQFNAGPK